MTEKEEILTALGEALGCTPAETPEEQAAKRRRPHFPAALYHPRGKPIRGRGLHARRVARRIARIEVRALAPWEREFLEERWENALAHYQGRWKRGNRARSRERKEQRRQACASA
jgi:hypothetical protein